MWWHESEVMKSFMQISAPESMTQSNMQYIPCIHHECNRGIYTHSYGVEQWKCVHTGLQPSVYCQKLYYMRSTSHFIVGRFSPLIWVRGSVYNKRAQNPAETNHLVSLIRYDPILAELATRAELLNSLTHESSSFPGSHQRYLLDKRQSASFELKELCSLNLLFCWNSHLVKTCVVV